jgi:hypothetical protein
MTLSQAFDHLVREGFYLLWSKRLLVAVHVGFKVFIEEVED